MEPAEYVIDTEPITAKIKCGLFSSPVFVYYILNYTSKANWLISIDSNHYDQNCKCYSKDPYKLIPNEIEIAKSKILDRIRNQLSIDRIKQKDQANKYNNSVYKPKIDLMKHKNIVIKPIDWRD